jgi:hypothetical protein
LLLKDRGILDGIPLSLFIPGKGPFRLSRTCHKPQNTQIIESLGGTGTNKGLSPRGPAIELLRRDLELEVPSWPSLGDL